MIIELSITGTLYLSYDCLKLNLTLPTDMPVPGGMHFMKRGCRFAERAHAKVGIFICTVYMEEERFLFPHFLKVLLLILYW